MKTYKRYVLPAIRENQTMKRSNPHDSLLQRTTEFWGQGMGGNGSVGLQFHESVKSNRGMTVSRSLADGTAERACYILLPQHVSGYSEHVSA